MRNKLLVICGQTGTGKTSLAIFLARKFNGELISADSRQVYKGLDIGTGKDLKEIEKSKIKIWGYDLVEPKKNFSVGNYIRFAQKVINDIQKRDKLPILVGGTGLFTKGVTDGIPTAFVPRNLKLRKNLEEKDVNELFEIGLQTSQDNLSQKIEKRVDKRIKDGVEEEIKNLISSGISWDSQSMTSLGYRQWRGYFESKITKGEVIDNWKKEELRYAKRQLTWFKKDTRINWFDSSKKNFIKNVEKLVNKWYP